jgi:uncharacterized protein YidB (DUF937 family)
MSLLESILGALSGKTDASGADPLHSALNSLLTQSGGIQGLMSKFSQGGLGDVFASWVGMGDNKAISPAQLQGVVGSEQIQGLAAKLGVDPAKATAFLAEYLPKIIDKLTPTGQVAPGADHSQALAALLPSLLQSLGGKSPGSAA